MRVQREENRQEAIVRYKMENEEFSESEEEMFEEDEENDDEEMDDEGNIVGNKKTDDSRKNVEGA